jgi:hypothetical protein
MTLSMFILQTRRDDGSDPEKITSMMNTLTIHLEQSTRMKICSTAYHYSGLGFCVRMIDIKSAGLRGITSSEVELGWVALAEHK